MLHQLTMRRTASAATRKMRMPVQAELPFIDAHAGAGEEDALLGYQLFDVILHDVDAGVVQRRDVMHCLRASIRASDRMRSRWFRMRILVLSDEHSILGSGRLFVGMLGRLFAGEWEGGRQFLVRRVRRLVGYLERRGTTRFEWGEWGEGERATAGEAAVGNGDFLPQMAERLRPNGEPRRSKLQVPLPEAPLPNRDKL